MKKKPFVSILIFVLSALFFLSACVFNASNAKIFTDSGTEKIAIRFPKYPGSHPLLTSWRVVYEKDGAQKSLDFPANTKMTELVFEKNVPSPVLIFPIIGGNSGAGVFFKPAGCIYPFFTSASWEHGIAAEILLDILTKTGDKDKSDAKKFAKSFNWKRFCVELDAAAIEVEAPGTFDPWKLSKERLLSAIVTKKFTKRLFQMPKPEQVTVDAPFIPFPPPPIEQAKFYEPYIKAPPLCFTGSTAAFDFYENAENLLCDGTQCYIVQKAKFFLSGGNRSYSLVSLPILNYGFTWF